MTGDDDLKINAVIISRSRYNFSEMIFYKNIKVHLYAAFLSAAIVSGIIFFSINKTEVILEYTNIFESFLNETMINDEFHVFIILLKNALFFLFILLFLSFCAFGDILIYIISFIKFAGIGAFVSFLYTQYGISGIKYLFYVFLPGKIIFIIAILNFIHTCIENSHDIKEKNRLPSPENRSLVIRLIFTVVLILFSLLIDTVTMSTFSALTGITSFI